MTPAFRRRASQQSGFTLLEVLITFVILAFGMLTLAMMQLYAMRQSSQGRHTGDASSIGRSFLEQAQRVPWTVLDTAEAAGTWVAPAWAGAPAAQVTVNQPGGGAVLTEQTYTVQWRVTDIGAAPVCLRDVEVRVTWNEDDQVMNKQVVIGTRRFNKGDSNC